MHIKTLFLTALVSVLPLAAWAQDKTHHNHADHLHGSEVWHAFILQSDYGASNNGAVASVDFHGWIGTDENKLWLKAELERAKNVTEKSELWAMYSRNIHTFWDFQAGVRHDTRPLSTTYAVLGVSGLAPYYFETEAHLFVSDEGDVSARLRQENEFLLTQKLILTPYVEANLFAQDVPEQNIGAGLSSGEIGIQTRYEITRKFAPYIDLRYEQKFGQTSSMAKKHGEDSGNAIASLGLRLMF